MRQGCSPDPDAIFLLNQLPRLTSSWLKSSTGLFGPGGRRLCADLGRLFVFFWLFLHPTRKGNPASHRLDLWGSWNVSSFLSGLGSCSAKRRAVASWKNSHVSKADWVNPSWCLSCSCSWLLRSILWFSSLEF